MMDRRKFIVLAGAFTAFCTTHNLALAQGTEMTRLALISPSDLSSEMAEGKHPYWSALLVRLRELGWIEDKTTTVKRWSGRGMNLEDYAALSQKVVGTHPDVIVVRGQRTIEIARKATSTIPIVGLGTFPIDLRARPARPGGNLTGISATIGRSLQAKMMQLLSEAIPKASRIAWLGSKTGPVGWGGGGAKTARAAAEQLELTLIPSMYEGPAANETELATAIKSMAEHDVHAVYIASSTQHFGFRDFLANQLLAARLPAIGFQLEHARAGQLLSYAPDFVDSYRRLATYVDRILRGADPGELPIEQPTEVKLVINLKTARALGITVPPKIMIQAAELVE